MRSRTRVKASNSRYRTLTTATLAERWKRIEQQIEQTLSEVEATEAAAEAAAGEVRGGKRATQFPVELADLQTRQEKRKGVQSLIGGHMIPAQRAMSSPSQGHRPWFVRVAGNGGPTGRPFLDLLTTSTWSGQTKHL